eukprot:gene6567-13290_t
MGNFSDCSTINFMNAETSPSPNTCFIYFLLSSRIAIYRPMVAKSNESVENVENVIDITGDGGVKKTIVQQGEGETVPVGSFVRVHYIGSLTDGKIFDSSRKRGSPFQFKLGARDVILGWDKCVETMKKGEICNVILSPDYAYGSSGIGPIPPNATLSFNIELIDCSITSPSLYGYYFAAVVGVFAVVVYFGLSYFF